MRGEGRRVRNLHGAWVVVLLIVVSGDWRREMRWGVIRVMVLFQKMLKHLILLLLNILHFSNLLSDIARALSIDSVEISTLLWDISSCWLMFLLDIYQWRWLILLRHEKPLSSRCICRFFHLCTICFFDLFRWQKESWTLLHAFFRRIYPRFMAPLHIPFVKILKSIEVVCSCSDIVGLPVGWKNF